MKVALWITQVILGLMFIMAGVMKLMNSPEEAMASDPETMAWIEDVSAIQFKLIGAFELIAAILVIIPPFLKKFTKISAFAALAIVGDMAFAARLHVTRDEAIYMNIVLALIAAFVAYAKFKTDRSSDGV